MDKPEDLGGEKPATTEASLAQQGQETQRTISEWAVATFGEAGSNARVAARANAEMSELLTKLTMDDGHPKAGEEMADVAVCLFRLAERMGYDLLAEVDKKMFVNRARQWELDGPGHGQHVRAPSRSDVIEREINALALAIKEHEKHKNDPAKNVATGQAVYAAEMRVRQLIGEMKSQ
jgi:hypothetical protein